MVNVAVLGAAGGIGQPLSMLLKLQLPVGTQLSLYDVAGVEGVAADISHIDTPARVFWAQGKIPPTPNCPELQRLAKGATGAGKPVDVFVIVAGVPRKPGMTRDDLFAVNAGIILDLVSTCAKVAPNAAFCIVTNPVNSTVPIAAQVLKKLGCYDRNKLFGVTLLDGLRATAFLNEARSPVSVRYVPVVGGHSDVTIVPLLSQVPGPQLPQAKIEALSKRIQDAGTEVVKAKAGKGSATLSMAAAGARFAMNVVDGLTGRRTPIVYAYVDSGDQQANVKLPFFALPVVLGKTGIVSRLGVGAVSDYEKQLLLVAGKEIAGNITKGEQFARSKL